MTLATLKKVNDAISHHGVELVKDFDYFYFADCTEGYTSLVVPESVMVRRITDLTLEEWVAHVDAAAEEA